MVVALPVPGLCRHRFALEDPPVLLQAAHLLPPRFLLCKSSIFTCYGYSYKMVCTSGTAELLLLYMQWANLATIAYLLFGSSNPHFGTMVYALADGPLAGALLVWQSAWVFGSAAHCVR